MLDRIPEVVRAPGTLPFPEADLYIISGLDEDADPKGFVAQLHTVYGWTVRLVDSWVERARIWGGGQGNGADDQCRAIKVATSEAAPMQVIDMEGGQALVSKVGAKGKGKGTAQPFDCLLYTSPSPRDATLSRMPSSA